MGKRNGVQRVLHHDRMRLTLYAVGIELTLEQFVDSFIDVERRPLRLLDFKAHIEPETTWTLFVQLNFAAAHLKRRFLAKSVRLAPFPPVVVRHTIIVLDIGKKAL